MYTGHLYEWKGVHVLARAAKLFKDDHLFVFVGGAKKHIADFKNNYSSNNILMVGQKPHEEIPLYLKSADVLVVPNSGKEDISKIYTSPMKIFEYMASGVPIIASDLPSIREILNERNAVFFESDNEKILADSIKKVLNNSELSDSIAGQSLIDSKKYSWENRATGIMGFVNKSIKV